jgi:hypothetical protein
MRMHAQVLDGHHKLQAAVELLEETKFYSPDSEVYVMLDKYKHMSIESKQF